MPQAPPAERLAPADTTFETNSLRILARLLVRSYLQGVEVNPRAGEGKDEAGSL